LKPGIVEPDFELDNYCESFHISSPGSYFQII
jgi:hypothetical protein